MQILLEKREYRIGINYPIILQITFYVPDKRRRDISNLYEGIQDCMVSAGVLVDDNWTIVAGHDGSRVMVDVNNPRIDVKIFKL